MKLENKQESEKLVCLFLVSAVNFETSGLYSHWVR